MTLGVNEGALCGLKALTGTGVSELPTMTAEAVLATTWNRTKMMEATKAAFQLGRQTEAVNAAICCQENSPSAKKCLQEHREDVANWLKLHSQ